MRGKYISMQYYTLSRLRYRLTPDLVEKFRDNSTPIKKIKKKKFFVSYLLMKSIILHQNKQAFFFLEKKNYCTIARTEKTNPICEDIPWLNLGVKIR